MPVLETPSLAVVTGASSGIGAAIARILAARGWSLLLIARRAGALDALAREIRDSHGIAVDLLVADLATEPGLAAALDTLTRRDADIGVLVNNAGVGTVGPFEDMPPAEIQRIMDLNMVALTRLTRSVLPGMTARKKGRILNVASTAAFQPGPEMAVYFATKAYVTSLSQALASETQGTGVTVTALCPGATATEFGPLSGIDRTRAFSGLLPIADPEAVARFGIAAMEKGRRLAIHGWYNVVLAMLSRIAPMALILAVTRRLLTRSR